MKSTYADQLNAARLMLNGLKNQGGTLAKRGLDAAFTARFEAALADAQRLDAEQEALKARLAEKTAEFNAKLDEANKAVSEAKKLVRMDLPKETWKEFRFS